MRAGLLLHFKNLKIKYLMCKTHYFLTGCTFIQGVPAFSRQTLSVYSTSPDRKFLFFFFYLCLFVPGYLHIFLHHFFSRINAEF